MKILLKIKIMYLKPLLLFVAFCMLSFHMSAQSILGNWKTIDDATGEAKSIVKIYKAKNGKVYGKIEKLIDTSEGHNPVCNQCPGDRKGKNIVGMIIIRDMVSNGKVWKSGKILDPENGKEYTCKLWLEGGNLKVRGYWGVFYRTQTWYKS